MKRWNYCSKWSMSYDDTVNYIREEFFKWYGVTPSKNIIRVVSVFGDRLYLSEFDDYNDVFTINFMIDPKNDAAHHHYILKDNGCFVEIKHCMEHLEDDASEL